MRCALGIAVAALMACKSSGSETSEGGAATQPAAVAGGSRIDNHPTRDVPIDQAEGRVLPTGSTSAHAPISPGSRGNPQGAPGGSNDLDRTGTSLAELAHAPLPEIEGEPSIAVFVERVSGGLMPDIEHATSRLRAGMRACYLRSLGEDPPDASRLAVRIVVTTNGSVKSARSESASGIDESTVDCMVRRAQAATFPAPVGEPAEIVLRITFLPARLP